MWSCSNEQHPNFTTLGVLVQPFRDIDGRHYATDFNESGHEIFCNGLKD